MFAMALKTHFSRSGGQQWVDSNYRPPFTTGNALFVDSVNGGTSGGFSPETALTTLIGAQTVAVANNGDVVYVHPLHAESVIGAAGMTFSKAGVTYQGLGNGRNRPTITFSTSTAAQIIVSGANITFKNMVFDFSGIDQIVAAISVTAADVAFEDCEFLIDNGTNHERDSRNSHGRDGYKIPRRALPVPRHCGCHDSRHGLHQARGRNRLCVPQQFLRRQDDAGDSERHDDLAGADRNNRFHIYTGTKGIALGCRNDGRWLQQPHHRSFRVRPRWLAPASLGPATSTPRKL
jgi:hypothetical protein